MEYLNKKYKGLILTVGAQGEQIKFTIDNIKPEYLGLIGTDTTQCKNIIDDVSNYSKLPITRIKVEYVNDTPDQVKNIIQKFELIYNWMKSCGIKDEEIVVDPTGGRKWMSAGLYMISAFRGLVMIYVDAPYKDGKPDPENMKLVNIGNAYDQTGFLEELKADKLFNEYNFTPAIGIYSFLSEKLSDPRKTEIKKLIAEGLNYYLQFSFEKAHNSLSEALRKINQFEILKEFESHIKKQIEILEILKRNDTQNSNYFSLLKDHQFSEKILLTLISQSEIYAEIGHFDFAVILLYRTLELISQIKLALHNIDTGNIPQEIKEKYNEEFKKITKEIFGAESEIPDRIALLHGWILLYCLKDEIVKKEEIKFLKGMRKQIEVRDLLWIEHKNRHITKDEYERFKKYVEMWVSKIDKNFKEKLKDYKFIKFK